MGNAAERMSWRAHLELVRSQGKSIWWRAIPPKPRIRVPSASSSRPSPGRPPRAKTFFWNIHSVVDGIWNICYVSPGSAGRPAREIQGGALMSAIVATLFRAPPAEQLPFRKIRLFGPRTAQFSLHRRSRPVAADRGRHGRRLQTAQPGSKFHRDHNEPRGHRRHGRDNQGRRRRRRTARLRQPRAGRCRKDRAEGRLSPRTKPNRKRSRPRRSANCSAAGATSW